MKRLPQNQRTLVRLSKACNLEERYIIHAIKLSIAQVRRDIRVRGIAALSSSLAQNRIVICKQFPKTLKRAPGLAIFVYPQKPRPYQNTLNSVLYQDSQPCKRSRSHSTSSSAQASTSIPRWINKALRSQSTCRSNWIQMEVSLRRTTSTIVVLRSQKSWYLARKYGLRSSGRKRSPWKSS